MRHTKNGEQKDSKYQQVQLWKETIGRVVFGITGLTGTGLFAAANIAGKASLGFLGTVSFAVAIISEFWTFVAQLKDGRNSNNMAEVTRATRSFLLKMAVVGPMSIGVGAYIAADEQNNTELAQILTLAGTSAFAIGITAKTILTILFTAESLEAFRNDPDKRKSALGMTVEALLKFAETAGFIVGVTFFLKSNIDKLQGKDETQADNYSLIGTFAFMGGLLSNVAGTVKDTWDNRSRLFARTEQGKTFTELNKVADASYDESTHLLN